MGSKKVLVSLLFVPSLFFVGAAAAQVTEVKTLIWADGTQYVGETVDNKRNGQGTIIWEDGTRFEGQFLNDMRNGLGTMTLPDGSSYTGTFESDELTRIEDEPTRTEKAVVENVAIETVAPAPAEQEAINVKQAVIDVVDLWATAWSDQNEELYLSVYSQNFKAPDGLSRAEWEDLRTIRINAPDFIELELVYTSFQMIAPDLIDVAFNQLYNSGTYSDEASKVLTLQKEDNEWKIVLEETISEID